MWKNETDGKSMQSSVARSGAWSILSGKSLSDISALSVFRLPITLNDIVDLGTGLTFEGIIQGLTTDTHRILAPSPPGAVIVMVEKPTSSRYTNLSSLSITRRLDMLALAFVPRGRRGI